MPMSVTVTGPGRLRDPRVIAETLRAPGRGAARTCVLHVRERGDDGPTRCAVVASRRVGGAVRRNRSKRLLREAARYVPWRDGLDLVLVARHPAAGSSFQEVATDLSELARRLGALRPEDELATQDLR